jgi:uncharacterized membrane protein SpoIIM required for sporulation
MKVSDLLEARRRNWQELEALVDRLQMASTGTFLLSPQRWFGGRESAGENLERRGISSQTFMRYSLLYRSACADLALADAYQLPPNTVQYLHRLVGRAHNQLYRSRKFQWDKWGEVLLHKVPQTVFHDRCVQFMFLLFWGTFIMAALLANSETAWPGFAETLLGREHLEQMEEMYGSDLPNNPQLRFMMAGFYIKNNTGIGLQCFAFGLAVIPGIMVTVFNAAVLGGTFGYMARDNVQGTVHFFEFVSAHGPFELTAIVLAAGAGMRLGLGWIYTNGLTRADSLRRTAREAMPIMGSSMILFFLAALIEGFVSPSQMPVRAQDFLEYIGLDEWITAKNLKIGVAVVSSALLMFYFLLLGMPKGRTRDAA